MVISVDEGVVKIHADLAVTSVRRLPDGVVILEADGRRFIIPANVRVTGVRLDDGTILPVAPDGVDHA